MVLRIATCVAVIVVGLLVAEGWSLVALGTSHLRLALALGIRTPPAGLFSRVLPCRRP